MIQPAIRAEGLVKTYPGEVRALDGLSFAVAPGTVFGMLGPNGAGKSTTVKILTTLARADSGSAAVAGHDVVKEQERVRRSIGVVAQRSGVDREATGRENIRLQGQMYGLRGRPLEQRVGFLLESFGLAEGRPNREDVLGRDATPARRRARARPRTRGALPRRAHHRARPRRPRRHVARD